MKLFKISELDSLLELLAEAVSLSIKWFKKKADKIKKSFL